MQLGWLTVCLFFLLWLTASNVFPLKHNPEFHFIFFLGAHMVEKMQNKQFNEHYVIFKQQLNHKCYHYLHLQMPGCI